MIRESGRPPRRLAVVLLFIAAALAGLTTPSRAETDPITAAQACQEKIPSGLQAFAGCWTNQMFSPQQRQVATCYARSNNVGEVAACAHGVSLDKQEDSTLTCAAQSGGSATDFAECLGQSYLTPAEQAALACVDQTADITDFGACVAGGSLLSSQERVMLHCALMTGGEPTTLATCVGGELTMKELEKCVAVGVGGRGCFGPNNTATALVEEAWYGAGTSTWDTARNLGHELSQTLGGCNWFRHPFGC